MYNSSNNTIIGNNITCNGFNGIQTNFSSTTIYGNLISGCESGIYSENSNNTISSNNLINNTYGVWTYNSTDTIHFNRIVENTHGLRNDRGIVNATNNWWGTNNPTIPNDVWIVSGNVTYNPWLVLNLNISSVNSGGNTSVTADLTRNSDGLSTVSQGFIPDGTPVNFNTNTGTIIDTAYTIRGQAVTILNLNSTQPQNATVSASVDTQSVLTTGFVSIGTALLTLNSTALDNSTGQLLNTTYTIPLNSSVTWLSVLWINKDMFTDELQIIVDGSVVQSKYFYNAAYETWKNSYSSSVFNAILYTNLRLPFTSNTTAFWNNLTTTYNLTSTELTFIQNHHKDFIDNITVNIVYSGVSGFNLNVTDPDNSTNVFSLNFPGNVIQRTSQVIYLGGSSCDGLKSFAIATTCVNNNVLQYWQNQYSNYQTADAMNVAYNTFLTALMLEYSHDQIADNITTRYNVTWSRTNPIIVSVGEDAHETYITLECDHSMGMTVVGTLENVKGFNYICSSAISNLEYTIMNTAYNSTYSYGTFSSVMNDMYYASLNNFTETFIQNSYIIVKHEFNDNEFIIVDLETGIVRDINTVNNFCGGFKIDPTKVYKGPIPLSWVSDGYRNWVVTKGQVDNLGTFWFYWDGLGSVYIASSPIAYQKKNMIWVDDTLIVNGIEYPFADSSGVYSKEAIDITSILQKDSTNLFGLYSVQIKIVDVYGQVIGCSPLWVVNDAERDEPDEWEYDPIKIPTPTTPPLPWNESNPPYDPFSYNDSNFPIDININKVFRRITNTTDSNGEPPFLPEKGEMEFVFPYGYDAATNNYYVWRIRYRYNL
ncbi:hypothetical protein MXE27_00785 [Methanobacterium alcaliphilum]|nr:hypothetical protein [Methanobacterium alcaliphilum]